MTNAYLFTWTPNGWPYANLRALVDDFENGKEVTEPWRCMAHRAAQPGDSAYFLKLGGHPQGIFGTGTITGGAIQNGLALPGQNVWQVPVTFRQLVDPTQTLLVSEQELSEIPVPSHIWHPQGSGIRLPEQAARTIDEIIAKRSNQFIPAQTGDVEAFDPLNVEEGREKINRSIAVRRGQQAFRSLLLDTYDRKCAVTGCDIEDLLEAAHIIPYRGPQTNHVQNGILLRSDIHTLFDCGLITVDPETDKVILSPRIIGSSYRQLAGRRIRRPKDVHGRPSKAALLDHRKRCGL